MSEYKPEVWTTKGLVDHIYNTHTQMPDRAFAFILGAGASVSSGIPSGGALVDRWLSELKTQLEKNEKVSLKEWATAENTEIEDFDYSDKASFYSAVYKRRFRDDKEAGYACIEHIMERGEPGVGYAILARILADEQHKVVITTNFDNLVSDALAIHTSRYPLVLGHESLSSFVPARPRRPLIAKIHRDLLLNPISDDGVDDLKGDWGDALKKIFSNYTPVVIGYGGNDGSLMKYLNKLDKGSIPGGMFWCYRGDNKPEDELVIEVLSKHRGKLVSIPGFDEFMLELGSRFGIGYHKVKNELAERGEERLEKFARNFEKIQKEINESPEVSDEDGEDLRKAVNAGLEGVPNEEVEPSHWWDWQLRINKETDDDKKEELYRKAIEVLPNSYQLIGNFALFLHEVRGDYDEAERLYRDVLEMAPNYANNAGNFALFMQNIRKDDKEAERLYRRALELDPNDARHTGNFAGFMKNICEDYDEAERLYRCALELDPDDAIHVGNFANFMSSIRKEYDEAERLYRRALEVDPDDPRNIGNFALLLASVRKDFDEAERLYRRALVLNPNNANVTGSFAHFMDYVRKDYNEAERLYRHALELDGEYADTHANFAALLLQLDRNDEAQKHVDKACELVEGISQTLAEAQLYQVILSHLNDEDDSIWLQRLKGTLQAGYKRGNWDFAPLFDSLTDRLDPDTLTFYRKIGAAILDKAALPELEKDERWQALEPIEP